MMMARTGLLAIMVLAVAACFPATAEVSEPGAADNLRDSMALEGEKPGVMEKKEVSRPVIFTFQLEMGEMRAVDTYLSILHYKGPYAGLSGRWEKAFTKKPYKWSMHFDTRTELAWMHNPSQTSVMPCLGVEFSWGTDWRKTLAGGFLISAGPSVRTDIGLLYAMRNGNNPVSAKAYAGLSLNASAIHTMRWGRLPVRISERVELPSIGAFFTPQYGESYYEIWLGNRTGLAHFGWWGNNFRIISETAIELDFGRTSLKLGYRFCGHTVCANQLITRMFTNAFTIGVVPGGTGIKRPRGGAGVNVITPFD